jgi:hypothetical protein
MKGRITGSERPKIGFRFRQGKPHLHVKCSSCDSENEYAWRDLISGSKLRCACGNFLEYLDAHLFSRLRDRLERFFTTMRSRPGSLYWNPLTMPWLHHDEEPEEAEPDEKATD